ncbi:MAG: hypothetical protein QOF76_3305 [Solirubrobacteraceae bacterium]|jgi:hypothetical protein|nr:hypothetical protein [Solirubrobacteraceae bacterium]
MTVPTRLFAPDREELFEIDAWLRYEPRERGVADVWMTTDGPAIPPELVDALGVPADEVRARPGHPTGAHTHDVFACLRQGGKTHFVAGIEAATGDGFGPSVADTGGDELAKVLFGRADDTLKTQPHRLWAAAVATIIEAQERGVPACALVIHQLRGDDDVSAFAAAVEAAGGVSHATADVAAGTRIRVLSVRR